jgi:hypothetical protein
MRKGSAWDELDDVPAVDYGDTSKPINPPKNIYKSTPKKSVIEFITINPRMTEEEKRKERQKSLKYRMHFEEAELER